VCQRNNHPASFQVEKKKFKLKKKKILLVFR
jgi:hypothetical protein